MNLSLGANQESFSPACRNTGFPNRGEQRCGLWLSLGANQIPLWRDAAGTLPNLPAGLLERLKELLAAPVTAQDLFAYTYGVLSAPAYVADFAEELSLPPPRVPITADAALFVEVTALGRHLLWLHTYGERFVPVGQVPGRVPPGRARSLKGVGAAGHACPEDFEWLPDPASPHDGVLRVGDGKLGPVSRAVWDFSVSGNHVLQSWLAFRMRNRSGKKSSPLDDIRPAQWDVELSRELRELIWVLEATLDTQPDLNVLFRRIVSGPVLRQDQLPQPTPAERLPPGDDDNAQAQLL